MFLRIPVFLVRIVLFGCRSWPENALDRRCSTAPRLSQCIRTKEQVQLERLMFRTLIDPTEFSVEKTLQYLIGNIIRRTFDRQEFTSGQRGVEDTSMS